MTNMLPLYHFQKSVFCVINCILATVKVACYFPDGDSVSNLTYQPCNNIGGVTSMCCALNRTNPSGGNVTDGAPADKYLPNGLCEYVFVSTDNGTTTTQTAWIRYCCTDASWNSAGCLKFCTKRRYFRMMAWISNASMNFAPG